MTDEQRVARIVLMVFGSAVVVAVAGYFLFSGGLGGGNDVEGEWLLTLPLDTTNNSYKEGEPEFVEVVVEFDRSESGELFGRASAEYAYDTYSNLEVNDIKEVDGKTSFKIEGWDDDDSGSDKMTIRFYDSTNSPGELEGDADGQVGFQDPDVLGTFTGERR